MDLLKDRYDIFYFVLFSLSARHILLLEDQKEKADKSIKSYDRIPHFRCHRYRRTFLRNVWYLLTKDSSFVGSFHSFPKDKEVSAISNMKKIGRRHRIDTTMFRSSIKTN